jgi:hypothetical protein
MSDHDSDKNEITVSKSAPQDASKERTEVDEAADAMMRRMLFGPEQRPAQAQGCPRIVLAIDATSSMGEFIPARKVTPEAAATIAGALFAKAGSAGLHVKLAFFRGDDRYSKQPRQLCVPDKWYDSAEELARAIAAIEHWSGWTQHCRLLRHVTEEAEKLAIQDLVIISDAFEERTPRRPQGDDLKAALIHAKRLRDLGVTITVGFRGVIRGGCPLDRAGVSAEEAFRDIAEANGGAVFLFDPAHLGERFTEIAERAALAAKGDAVGAQALLQHLRTVPFDFVVGEQEHVGCGTERETERETERAGRENTSLD